MYCVLKLYQYYNVVTYIQTSHWFFRLHKMESQKFKFTVLNHQALRLVSLSACKTFAEKIFMDAMNVTPDVHNNYKKIFAHKIFEVGGRSSKNSKNKLRL